MNLREREFQVQYEEDTFPLFEERVLASGLCDFAIPMQFVHRADGVLVTYGCGGYTSLSEVDLSSVAVGLEVLAKVFRTLKKTDDFLIDPRHMELSVNTVYFHRRRRHIRIAYMPAAACSLYLRLPLLIKELQQRAGVAAGEYMEKISVALQRDNLTMADAAILTEQFRKEAYECGIE